MSKLNKFIKESNFDKTFENDTATYYKTTIGTSDQKFMICELGISKEILRVGISLSHNNKITFFDVKEFPIKNLSIKEVQQYIAFYSFEQLL